MAALWSLSPVNGGYMDFKSPVSVGKVSASPVSAALKSDSLFAKIKDELAANPDKAKSIGGVFLYNVTDGGKVAKKWTLDLANGSISEGEPEGKPSTTLTVADEDLIQIATGKLSPEVAYMKGKLKIAGNIMLAQKLGPLLKSSAKL